VLENAFLLSISVSVVGVALREALSLTGPVGSVALSVAAGFAPVAHAGHSLTRRWQGALHLCPGLVVAFFFIALALYCSLLALYVLIRAYTASGGISSALVPLSVLLIIGSPVVVAGVHGARWALGVGWSE
jgi:hypothetical protein